MEHINGQNNTFTITLLNDNLLYYPSFIPQRFYRIS